MTVDRVTLQVEHVPQFVVVRLASFVFYFIFILSLNNHLDPFYRDRFYPDRFYRLPAGQVRLVQEIGNELANELFAAVTCYLFNF